MITKPPAERPLPHKQDILERVLAGETPQTRTRTWLIPVAAAASIAVVAGGLVAATSGHENQPAPGPAAGPTPTKSGKPSAKSTPAGPADVRVNVGPLKAAEASALAEACVSPAEGHQGEVGEISHAFTVRSWVDPRKTENSVVVLDKSNGLIYGCVGFPTAKTPTGEVVDGFEAGLVGGDPVEARKGKSVINPTDATHPAVPTDSGGSRYFIDFDRSPDRLMTDAWYRVDERVAEMRQRYVIKGKPGPWFVGDAVDGTVFLRAWDESTALQKGDEVRIETQVLDRNGKLLDAPADQKGGGGLTPSPGTTRVDIGKVGLDPGGHAGWLNFPNR
ncbi:hypothetical protein GCM10009789_33850 [Kribbella sancticallisti]|uniref:Uncharacterized protein n=1 Tax=Kribbella sancticallisti TaxID=460087 RepID=A0ABP4PCQ2_9ACTN